MLPWLPITPRHSRALRARSRWHVACLSLGTGEGAWPCRGAPRREASDEGRTRPSPGSGVRAQSGRARDPTFDGVQEAPVLLLLGAVPQRVREAGRALPAERAGEGGRAAVSR